VSPPGEQMNSVPIRQHDDTGETGALYPTVVSLVLVLSAAGGREVARVFAGRCADMV
jgi:hypothetical protein